ncbi:MAG: hypothetical protein ACK55I_14730, partial [bacterium]
MPTAAEDVHHRLAAGFGHQRQLLLPELRFAGHGFSIGGDRCRRVAESNLEIGLICGDQGKLIEVSRVRLGE